MAIRIGEHGVELLLLQVDPGFEDPIAESLRSNADGKDAADHVAKCFGKYDIIAMRKFTDKAHGLNLIDHRLLDKVLAVEQVLGFSWQTKNTEAAFEARIFAADWIGVALVKLNHQLLFEGDAPILNQYRKGVGPIEELLASRGLNFLITGTLGWFDLAVILWGDDLRAIADAVADLRDSEIEMRPLLDFTWTAFGVDYAFIEKRKKWKDLKEPAKTRIELQIRCRHPQPADLLKRLQSGEYFGTSEVGICFGDYDIYVRPNVSIGKYLEQLIDLRKENGANVGELFATSTNFMFERSPVPSVPEGARSRGPTNRNRPQSYGAGHWVGLVASDQPRPDEPYMQAIFDQEKRFSQLFMSKVSSSLQRESYEDMVNAVEYYREHRTIQFPTERLRREVMHLMNFGYEQRSMDLIETSWNFGVPTTLYYTGGAQRILWAAEYLIDDIAKQLNVEWHGFAAFGIYGEEFLRTHLGVISLPIRTLLSPGEWWGVFHETAHEVIHQSERFVLLSERVIELQTNGKPDILSEVQRARVVHRISELVAEAIAFRRSFFGDWSTFLDCFNEYIVDYLITPEINRAVLINRRVTPAWALGEVLPRQLAKLFGVYVLAKEANLLEFGDLLVEFRNTAVQAILDRTKSAITKHNDDLASVNTALEATVSRDAIGAKFMTYGYNHVLFEPDVRGVLDALTGAVPDERSRQAAARKLETLKDGEVVTDSVDLPQLAVLAMRPHGSVPFKWKTALILSFWNAYGERIRQKQSKSER